MDNVKFLSTFDSLGELFGKPIKADLAGEYFKILGRLENWQFDRVCEQAKRECEMFPKPVTLLRIAEAAGYFRGTPGTAEMKPGRWICVECICEEHWSVDRVEIERNPEVVYRCKNPECGASIPGRAILAREYKGFAAFSKFWNPVFRGE